MITAPNRIINSGRESKIQEKSYLMLDLGVLAEDIDPIKMNEVVTPMRVFNK